jgi:hypothetical protein
MDKVKIKMGRPATGRTTVSAFVGVAPTDKAALEELAKAENKSFASYCGDILKKHLAEKRTNNPSPAPTAG